MVKKLRTALVFALATAILAAPFGALSAQQTPYTKERDAGAMTADLVLARPLGLAAIVCGAVVYVVSIPFSATGNNMDQAFQKLVADPARYTFQRPLGDF